MKKVFCHTKSILLFRTRTIAISQNVRQICDIYAEKKYSQRLGKGESVQQILKNILSGEYIFDTIIQTVMLIYLFL